MTDLNEVTEFDRQVGLRLLEIRERRGISEEKVAMLLYPDVTVHDLRDYERGLKSISLSLLPRLSEALGVPLFVFFPEVPVVSPADWCLLHDYRRLNETSRTGIRRWIAFLLADISPVD